MNQNKNYEKLTNSEKNKLKILWNGEQAKMI